MLLGAEWLPAFLVVIGHLRSFIFINYAGVEQQNLLVKLFYYITGFGHQAVMVFFIISGYLVGGGLLMKYKENKLDSTYLKLYFIKRFSRIYIVLIPALIMGYFLDSLGLSYFTKLYHNFYHISSMNNDVVERLSLDVLMGNLFNLQTIFVEPLGSNGPLWSLANEWWYYILFAFLFINNITRLIFIFIVGVLFFQNEQILVYSFIWLLGASLVLVNKKLLHQSLSFIILFIALLFTRKFTGVYTDFILAIALFLFINSISFNKNNVKKIVFKFNKSMANFSYSTYLFHFPFIVFVISALHNNKIDLLSMQPNINTFLYYLFVLSALYLYSYIMYLLFESKTYVLQKYLQYKLKDN